MAQQHEENMEDLLNQDLDNLFALEEPHAPDGEEASVSSNNNTDDQDDDPGEPGLAARDLADSSDEEDEDDDEAQPPEPDTREELEALLTREFIATLRGQQAKPKKPKGPTMGEVITVDGKRLIRMGGVPDCTWTKLTRKSKMHPNQFRSIDPTKHYKVGLGLKALDPVWTKSTKLSVLQNHVHQHLVASGMEQHEYLPDPHKPTRMVNVILQPHLFARDLEATTAAAKSQAQLYDGYDQGNDQMAHEFLLQCLDSDLNDKVGGLDHSDDLFLVTWIKVVRSWSIMTRERAQAIKLQVKNYRIQSVPGMNLSVAVAYLRPRLNALLETREIDPADLQGFLKSLHGIYPVESEHHLPWWSEINGEIIKPLKEACDKAKLEMRKGPCEVEEYLIKSTKDGTKDKGLDYKSILEKLEAKYDKAYHSEEWPAAKDPVDSKAAPTTFDATAVHHAQANSSQACTKADVMALMQNFDKLKTKGKHKGSKTDKTCHACGQLGHFARDPECPKNKAHVAKTPKTSNKKKFKKDKANWKHIPPMNGEPNTRTRDGKLWKWCAKCSNSRGRWTLSHNTDEHGKKPPEPTANFAAMADHSPCAWYASLPSEESWFGLFKTLGFLLLKPLVSLVLLYLVMCVAHSHAGPIMSAVSTHLDAVSNLATGVWGGLKVAGPWALELFHQALEDSPLICWLIPFVLLGIIHLLWYEPPGCQDHWWKEPRPPRRQRRRWEHTMRRWNKPRFKGASIKDKNFSKHYPRRLRAERRFWTRAPTHEERHRWTTFLGDWFRRNGQTTQASANKGAQHQGRWPPRNMGGAKQGSKGRRSYGLHHRPKMAPPPFRVQHGNKGFEACFNPKPPPQEPTKPRECWTCRQPGHIARECWTCGQPGHIARPCTPKPHYPWGPPTAEGYYQHSPARCLDEWGRSTCIYPSECPFAKVNSESFEYGRAAQHCNYGHVYPEESFEYGRDAQHCNYEHVCPEDSFMPSQDDLDRAASSATIPEQHPNPAQQVDEVVAFCVALDPTFIHAALCAPHKVKEAMPPDSSFRLIWDSGASHCITNNKKDFIGPIRSAGLIKTLTGLARGLFIRGVGTVAWTVLDVNGKPRTLKVDAYFVPGSPVRLLSTSQLLQTYSGETINLDDQSATLSGIAGDPQRAPVKAFVNPSNNIPDCSAFQLDELEQAALALNSMVTSVDPRNINLSKPEKELLRWHQRLGHLDFKKIQFLLRSGVLSWSASKRSLHLQAAKLTHPPKCAACQFGKQTTRPVKGRPTEGTAVVDRAPVLKEDKLFPGQMISVDHFVCTTKGVTPTSRGGANSPGYMGGCIMVDLASGLVHIEFQQHLNTHETLKGIEQFEIMCMDNGVVPTNYISDSGSAFTSKEFRKRLESYKQIITFVGTSAHHHNAVAERAIRTIMSIARTMMIHAATHWPEMADATLWPLAVNYAVYIFNRVPNRETGLSALDVFTSTRQPLRRLHDLHVFGSPAYLLDKSIADGKKIPRWKPKSERVIFVGISNKHFATCPMVLNPRTRAITTPYHVVFDDWFATIGSSAEEIPDFQSPEWQQLFGDSTYQFVDADAMDPERDFHEPLYSQMAKRRDLVGDALHRHHQPPLAPGPQHGFDAADQSAPTTQAKERENAWLREWQRQPTTPVYQPPAAPANMGPPKTPEPAMAGSKAHSPTPIKSEPTPIEVDDDVEATPTPAPAPTPKPKQSRMVRELADYNRVSQTTQDEPLGSRRTRRQPSRIVAGHMAALAEPMVFAASKSDPDTFTLEQALSQPENYHQWVAALEKEIRALEEHGVWEEVPVSEAKGDIIPTQFVMKIKRKPDGSLDKYKSRIVVRGDLMRSYGFETYSAVCAWSTIRMVLVLALTWGWITCTCDYSNAFIHATLDTPVWIRIPKGYESTMPGQTCLKLKRSLYGTSFAPKLWADTLTQALKDYGLKQSTHDPCLFSKPGVMACCYVDDLILAFKDPKERDNFFSTMKKLGFTLTMDDTLESFLGIKFERHGNGSFTLTQPALIQKIIAATNMKDCNPVSTPATPNQTLAKDPDGQPMTDTWSYSSVTGMLLYLSTNTRTDLVFAVSQVCRFNHSPRQSHAQAVKRIVRYLAGTMDMGTIMQPDGTLALNCWSDADFAGLYNVDPPEEASSARSRMGYLIKLGGCVIVSKSQLISCVCLATAEAEYYSLSHCLRVLLPIRRTLEELARYLEVPAELQASTMSSTAFEDNSAALALATNHRLTSRTRYYHTQSHFFWDEVKRGEVVPQACPTILMDADFLTKPMPRAGFEENRKRVMGW